MEHIFWLIETIYVVGNFFWEIFYWCGVKLNTQLGAAFVGIIGIGCSIFASVALHERNVQEKLEDRKRATSIFYTSKIFNESKLLFVTVDELFNLSQKIYETVFSHNGALSFRKKHEIEEISEKVLYILNQFKFYTIGTELITISSLELFSAIDEEKIKSKISSYDMSQAEIATLVDNAIRTIEQEVNATPTEIDPADKRTIIRKIHYISNNIAEMLGKIDIELYGLFIHLLNLIDNNSKINYYKDIDFELSKLPQLISEMRKNDHDFNRVDFSINPRAEDAPKPSHHSKQSTNLRNPSDFLSLPVADQQELLKNASVEQLEIWIEEIRQRMIATYGDNSTQAREFRKRLSEDFLKPRPEAGQSGD